MVEVIDLSGTYSLDVGAEDVSLDERVAHEQLRAGVIDLVVNVVDAANLERNLYLTSQLAELGVPQLVALNMVDVAVQNGRPVDAEKLAVALGCPVIPVVAARQRGIEALKAAIVAAARGQTRPRIALPPADPAAPEADVALAAARYALAGQWVAAAVDTTGERGRDVTAALDRVVLHRLLGLPIFLGVMYLMFMFTIRLGGAFIDFFDQAAGALFVDGPGAWLAAAGAPEWLTLLLAKGIGGGLQTVATFIPIIGFLYLFLAALEDSGY
ncbi:MAG: ferrous iron transporter B, partial [Rhodocyclaceae bacterium]|nr:ferrous iron transporter B [Rhodocyclaceae bacterium]